MDSFFGLTATGWTAIYTLLTLGMFAAAIGAAFYARAQWQVAKRQASETAKAQAESVRPYVVVSVKPSRSSQHLFDLVVENIGVRPALNVVVDLEPPPNRARETPGLELSRAKMLTEPIVMLAPGQEMRAFYDSHVDRRGRDDLPKSHHVQLRYEDSSGNHYEERASLDLEPMRGSMFVSVKTVHDVAKTLDSISETLKSASVLGRSGYLETDVAVETRAEHDEREERERKEREAQIEELTSEWAARQGLQPPLPERTEANE